MANLGFQSVYRLLNSMDGCVCERAFLPDAEDAAEYERTSTPLLSYESQSPVRDFDMVAFSVPFEDDYINIPRILTFAGMPVFSGDRAERGPSGPLVVAGGVALSLNPEPVAEFFDAFITGEGEGALEPLIEAFVRAGGAGAPRDVLLRELDSLEWVYVPSLYSFSYDGARITGVTAAPGAKKKVRAARRKDLGAYPLPENFILTPESEFGDTSLVEIERGCPRGCRFCAAGFLYLPPRWRDFSVVKEAVERGAAATGKVGLVGTAVSEYPEIKETVQAALDAGSSVTLSSLRLDRLDAEFVGLLKKGGYRTVTLAPEAGSLRMRRVVNKDITDEEILDAVRLVTGAGFTKIKLYFIIGLPAEEDADAQAVAELSLKIKALMGKGSLTLSVNPFIPKPVTPFQWHGFEREEVVDRRLSMIKKRLAGIKGVSLKTLSAREAFVQAYLARADRRASAFIEEAARTGWRSVVRKNKTFFEASACAVKERDEILAWDIIDNGVRKGYLWKEYQKGLAGVHTEPCEVGSCVRCGVC